jgi:hypothetical protein
VFDLPLDTPGAVPRSISNTTIPGTTRAQWQPRAQGALVQYLSQNVVKTVYLGFPTATSTATSTLAAPLRVQFLPDGILDFALSPSGQNVVYLLRSAAGGVDGYIAQANGASSRRFFSVPLRQLLLSWPSPATLLLQTPSAYGAPGMAFSVNNSTGSVVPLLSAHGLSAIADNTFSRIIYQTTPPNSSVRYTYVHNIQTGTDAPLSFDPFPEQCRWSAISTSTSLYCAAPLQYVAADYLDLWHLGAAHAPEALLSFNLDSGQTTILASPGGSDGGEESDIAEIALSPDESYLLFVGRTDRSLWGVRLKETPTTE